MQSSPCHKNLLHSGRCKREACGIPMALRPNMCCFVGYLTSHGIFARNAGSRVAPFSRRNHTKGITRHAGLVYAARRADIHISPATTRNATSPDSAAESCHFRLACVVVGMFSHIRLLPTVHFDQRRLPVRCHLRISVTFLPARFGRSAPIPRRERDPRDWAFHRIHGGLFR